MDRKVQEKINRLLDLPGLPGTVFEIVEVMRDPDVSVQQVSSLIEMDQSMTSKILRLVNSPFYGLAGKVVTISQALVILGLNTVRNAILSISVFEAFCGGKKAKESGFSFEEFWKHAAGTGVIARVLAQGLKMPDPEDLFTAGLLHDIGKVVTARLFESEFAEIIHLVEEKDLYMLEAERKILGFDHTYTGGCLAKKWNMPGMLSDSIRCHHRPAASRHDQKAASIIHVADCLCKAIGFGHAGDELVPELRPDALDLLGLKINSIAQFLPAIDAEIQHAENFMIMFRQ